MVHLRILSCSLHYTIDKLIMIRILSTVLTVEPGLYKTCERLPRPIKKVWIETVGFDRVFSVRVSVIKVLKAIYFLFMSDSLA